MPVLKEIDCQDSDEFLDLLSPRGTLFGGTEAVGSYSYRGDGWIYRGHADDAYLLTPSALRDEKSFLAVGGSDILVNNEIQVITELNTIFRFFNLADVTGLPLPEDSQALRKTFQTVRTESYLDEIERGAKTWPPRMLWSLLGIGQHYGIPTRLLDWSRKPFVAAYFAAEGAASSLHKAQRSADEFHKLGEKQLSVWAFRFDRLETRFNRDVASYFGESSPPLLPVVKVTAPHAHNPNLHAQDGLFTLEIQNLKGKIHKKVDRRPLQQLVENFLVENKKLDENVIYFYRIRLKWKFAMHVLWRLLQEGINQATIYPGYKGVVDAMKAEARYGH